MSCLLWRFNERSQFQRVSGDDYSYLMTHLLQFPGEVIVTSQKTETSIIAMPSEVVIVTSTVLTIFSARRRSMLLGITSNRSESDPPKKYTPTVPDSAVDECKDAHDAVDEQKEKASSDNFDAQGLMALVCRHDIALFFANINTPGEQQKYAVALLEHLFLPVQLSYHCMTLAAY
jgi:hypothetical protein